LSTFPPYLGGSLFLGVKDKNEEEYYFYCCKSLVDNHSRVSDIWGKKGNKKSLALFYGLTKDGILRTHVSNKPISKDFFGTGMQTNRVIALKFLEEKSVEEFKQHYNLKNIHKEQIFYYLIGLFFSENYRSFIKENNFDGINLPILFMENYADYVRQGHRKVNILK
ncbi:MAG: hypothetical protein OXH36_03290, partial [Bdellovibrionales bacterium]|nr:hypothetical protein [Bdellovibrionales bacterium]